MNTVISKNTQSLVSVIIRTKNRPKTLVYALESVIKQTYHAIEIILINDGDVFSADVSDYLKNIEIPVTLIENKTSRGRCKAGNQGLLSCSGDYIIFLDDDDWFNKKHIKSLVNALENKPDYLAAYAGVRFTDSPKSAPIHVFNTPYDATFLILENTIPIHALMFSRTLLDKGCKLDENLSVFEDWDLWLQFSQYTQFYHIDAISAGYRNNGDSEAGWGNDASLVKKNRQLLISKWQKIWTAEQLDKALHWGQKARQEALQQCQKEKGEVMESHSALHRLHKQLEESHEIFISNHQTLEKQHSQLISSHQSLEKQHSQLISSHQSLEEIHSELISDQQTLDKKHSQLISDHHTLEKIHHTNNIELTQLQKIFIKTQQRLRQNEHQLNQLEFNSNNDKNTLLQQLDNTQQQLNHAQQQLNHAQQQLDNILNSSIWKHSRPIRHAVTWLKAKKLAVKIRLKAYLVNNSAAISKILENKSSKKTAVFPCTLNAKVGVMLHVYYTDLFEPICHYLNKIPLPYQLMISVTNEADKLFIEHKKSLLNQQAQVLIKQVDNKGRDIAPMMLAFKDEIQALDIVAHIHTKKSYYAGSSQFGEKWLHYLLEKLLGNENNICHLLSTLAEDSNVGIIYPETYPDLPYWAHTWLSNRQQGEQLLNRIGFFDQDFNQYIDYPAGSMFWAKTRALKPLYDLQLSWDDFPEELGQTDNTLHHAIERCLVFSSQVAGYKQLLISSNEQCFELYPHNNTIFNQYTCMTPYDRVLGSSKSADVISFDIFDTLFIRPFALPDAVFWWLEGKIEKNFGVTDFVNKRKSSEALLRANLTENTDVRISDIYQQMAETYAIDIETAQTIQQLEITTEHGLLYPRKQLAEAARELKQQKQRLILVSDMYLEKQHLQTLIDQYLPDIFSSLYVSSDVGQRKDRGNIWATILDKEGISKDRLLHVGDNEHSDIQIPVDSGFHIPVHAMRPMALLGSMSGGQEIINVFRQHQTWQNELMLGLIANKILGYYEDQPNKATVFSQPHHFGYCIMGPILFSFMVWLVNSITKDKISDLLFLSRDGWLLEQLYNKIKSHKKIKNNNSLPPGKYFYCSRSFIGLASVESKEDFSILLAPHYQGTLKKLLQSRFGLQKLQSFIDLFGQDVLDMEVNLPQDREEIEQYLAMIYPAIQQQASADKAVFLNYWQQHIQHKSAQPAIVDIGYSGTLQKSMMKVTHQPINGYYFVTNESASQIIAQGGDCHSCFGHLLAYDKMNDLTIHRYSLLLEAIMTSPEGQLERFTQSQQKISPEFKEKGISQHHFDTIDTIHQGIINYTTDILDVLGDEIFELDFDANNVTELMSLVVNKKIDIGELTHSLSVEDEFSGNEELNVLDFYEEKNTLLK